MADFLETRTKSVDGRIINLDDFYNIAEHVFSEHEKSRIENPDSSRFSIRLERKDGVILKGSNLSILSESATILESRIIKAEVEYYDYFIDHKISVSISHADSTFSRRSYIEVEGKERSWVNGQLAVLDGMIGGIQAQNGIIRRFKFHFAFIAGIPIGYGYFDLLEIFFWNLSFKSQ